MPHQCTNCTSVFPDGSKEMLSGCPHCGGNTFQYIPEGADPEQYEPEATEPPDPPIAEDSVTGKVGRAASTVREYVNARRDEESIAADEDRAQSAKTDSTRTEAETGQTESSKAGNTSTSPDSTESETAPEDTAQASARGEVADLSDLTSQTPSETTGTGSTPERADTAPTDSDAATDDSEPSQSDAATPPREDARVVDEPDEQSEAATTDLETLRAELNDQFESIRIVEPGQYELNLMELYDREEHIIALREDGKYKIEVPDSWRDGDDQS